MRKFILSCLFLLTLLTLNVFSQTTQLNGDHLINGHFLVAKATDHDTKKLVFGPWRDNSHDLTIYRHNPDTNSNQLRIMLGYSETDNNKLLIGPYISYTIAPSMVVTANNKVGIGKMAPQSALDVNGTIQANAFSGTNSNKTVQIQTKYGILNIGAQHSYYTHFEANTTKFHFNKPIEVNGSIMSFGANDLVFDTQQNLVLKTNTAPRITILKAGYVGIGTSTPQNLLDVNGTIRAKEVKIETGWADFVFAEDYVLPSLGEVKTYIEENKHLPGLPSEKEVKENGVGVGEMQVKLLQKIEELTLYSIQQQEMLVKQQQMIEALQAQLNTQNP